MTRPLLVAERFGPTVQGEGPSTGQQALFIRLSRCNLSCPSCDTPYTWDWSRFSPRKESTKIDVNDLYAWATSQPAELVVITGGEPLLQQEPLRPLIQSLVDAGRRIEVETNGTVTPHPEIIECVGQFNVSPKTKSFAGETAKQNKQINPEALQAFTSSQKSIFKFVVTSSRDLDEVSYYACKFDLSPVWVMPEGTTRERILEQMPWLAEKAIRKNWNLSTRLHILLWGDERGR